MVLTKEVEAELRALHGEIDIVRVGGSDVVVRAPSEIEYFGFVDTLTHSTKSRSRAMKTLALTCTVFPDRKAAAELLSAKPARYMRVAEAASKLADDPEVDDLSDDEKKEDGNLPFGL